LAENVEDKPKERGLCPPSKKKERSWGSNGQEGRVGGTPPKGLGKTSLPRGLGKKKKIHEKNRRKMRGGEKNRFEGRTSAQQGEKKKIEGRTGK